MHLAQQCLSIKNTAAPVLGLVTLIPSIISLAWLSSTQYGLLYVSLAPPLSACWPVSLSIKSQYEHISVCHMFASPLPLLSRESCSSLPLFGSLSRFVSLQADSWHHLNMGNYMRFNTSPSSSSDPLTLCWTSVPHWRPHPVGRWATGSGPSRWSVTRRAFYRLVTRPCSYSPTSTQSE